MKKQLALAAGLAVLATPALASKARLMALGEDVDGSFYVNDNRNIFLNPSEVLNHKDMVTFEWGTGQNVNDVATAADDRDSLDNDGNSIAEGGFLRASGNLVWGAQLGRFTDFDNEYNQVATQGGILIANQFAPSNALDLFIGGDAGIKWGAQLTHSSRKDDDTLAGGAETEGEASETSISAGVATGNIAGYLKYGLSGKVETDINTTDMKRKSPMELGVSYRWMDYTFFGQYSSSTVEVDDGTTDYDVEFKSWQIGAARVSKLSDRASLFTKIAYVKSDIDYDDYGTDGVEANSKSLPVTIGLEYDAASWLALRGSISQRVLVNEEDNGTEKSTLANSTDVNAGASLKFGDFVVDGVIGTNGTEGTRSSNNTETGVLNTDNLMSRVSMTYRF